MASIFSLWKKFSSTPRIVAFFFSLWKKLSIRNCICLPDKDYGEIVGAIVVPQADVKLKRDQESKPVLSLEELSTWAKDKIAPYKVWQHGHCLCYISVRVYRIYQVRV